MNNTKTGKINYQASQEGVVLVVVLIFMLALSTLAIFSARNATLGERQSRNEVEFQIARQAAEAALRDAERDLTIADGNNAMAGAICNTPRGGTLRSPGSIFTEGDNFTETCLRGQCLVPASKYLVPWADATSTNAGEPWWPASKGGLWNNDFTTRPMRGQSSPANCDTFLGAVSLGVFTGAPALPGVARQPEYLIEYLSPVQDPIVIAGVSLENNRSFKCPTQVTSETGARGLDAFDTTGAISAPSSILPCSMYRLTARG